MKLNEEVQCQDAIITRVASDGKTYTTGDIT
jgi:hypothetical protein